MQTQQGIGPLLDHLYRVGGVRNDQQLAAKLKTFPSVISRLRSKTAALSDTLILAAHEELGIPVAEIRRLAGPKLTGEEIRQNWGRMRVRAAELHKMCVDDAQPEQRAA